MRCPRPHTRLRQRSHKQLHTQLRTRPHHLFFVGPADASWELHRELIAKSLNASESRYSTVEVQNLGKAQPLWKLHGEAGLQRRSNATTTLDQPKLVLNAAAARQSGN